MIEEIEYRILERLKKMRALTYEQLADLEFEGDRDACYKVVQKLKGGGFVVIRKVPDDMRCHYVMLSKTGLAYMKESEGKYLKHSRSQPLLKANNVYVEAVKAGFPPESIMSRDEALKHLGLEPRDNPLRWFMKIKRHGYVVYIRDPRKRGNVVDGARKLTANKVRGQVMIYFDEDLRRKDRRYFSTNPPSSAFYLLRLDHIPAFVSMLLNPNAWLNALERQLTKYAPGGRLITTPVGCPVDWAYDGRVRVLLGNLTVPNIGLVAILKSLSREQIEKERWGSYVLLVVETYADAQEWIRVLGWRDWFMFYVRSNPPEDSFFRVSQTKLVPALTRGKPS